VKKILAILVIAFFVLAGCTQEAPKEEHWETWAAQADNENACLELSEETWFNSCEEIGLTPESCYLIWLRSEVHYSEQEKKCYLSLPFEGAE